MVNTSNDKSVPKLYASSKELEALKHKLDSFIQEQDAHNKTITSSLEKLLKLAN
jgi:tetrahydromethanopterin S-methyltransferase subunit G